jgi:putative transposase
MPRLPRLSPIGVPLHIIQRGNNRQICFNNDEDMAVYANWLYDYSLKYDVHIHAWVFMTNHVHLLVTPWQENSVSRMMQSLGRNDVRYFNKAYRRSGTLWEGRFKSSLVESSEYLLQCYQYIELNPIRARIVKDPSDYHWSSYQCNGLGRQSKLLTPHNIYLALGKTQEERLTNYGSLFEDQLAEKILNDIRNSVNQGMVFGSEKFKDEIEADLQRRVRPNKTGPKVIK